MTLAEVSRTARPFTASATIRALPDSSTGQKMMIRRMIRTISVPMPMYKRLTPSGLVPRERFVARASSMYPRTGR